MTYDDYVETKDLTVAQQVNQQIKQDATQIVNNAFAHAMSSMLGGVVGLGASKLGQVENNQAMAPLTADVSKTEDEQYSDTISDEQKLIQKIAVMSDCNVVIQGKRVNLSSGGFTFGGSAGIIKYRMFCEKCKGSYDIPNAKWVSLGKYEQPEIVKFCKEHKHGIVPNDPEGRKFKDVSV